MSVTGGPERLVVKDAYTHEKPGKGAEVDVLWARSAPDLGGYVDEDDDLPTIAAGRWNAFPDSESGRASQLSFVLVAVVFGTVLTLVFTLAADADALQKLAWSPPAQTVRAGFAVAMLAGWRPILLGQDAATPELLLAGLGFLLILGVYIGTSTRSLL